VRSAPLGTPRTVHTGTHGDTTRGDGRHGSRSNAEVGGRLRERYRCDIDRYHPLRHELEALMSGETALPVGASWN